jgi:hypothetical protein
MSDRENELLISITNYVEYFALELKDKKETIESVKYINKD